MSDPWIENFRKNPQQRDDRTPRPQIVGAGSATYRAFETQDKVTRLDIQRATGPSHCPAIGYLLDIIYGRQFYSSFVLVFSFMTVTVKGGKLHDIVQAIRLGTCASICEFHPELFASPEPDAPIITSIEIVTAERIAEAAREADDEKA
jgi:hypothetical protein